MDKKILGRVFTAAAILAAAVLWLLSVIPATSEMFSWFSLAWAGAIISGAFGVRYVLGGAFAPTDSVSKKFLIFCGAGFLVLTVFCISWAIAMPEDMIAPIIAIILTGALFVGILFTGGRRWDGGDNQKAGYKDYRTRKAEEEREERRNSKDK